MATNRTGWGAGSTTGTTDRTVTATTPAVGDVFLVSGVVSGNANDTPTCTDDNGGTYSLISCQAFTGSAVACRLYCFIRNEFLANTTSTVVTIATGSNTSSHVFVSAIAGLSKAGSTAIRSLGVQANQSATTPAPVLSNTPLTANLCYAMVGSDDTTTTPPTSPWTEIGDQNQPTPTVALELATSPSGFTTATVTYGAAQSGGYASIAIEIDGSIIGTASVTQAADTVVATAQRTTHGDLAVTQAADTAAGTGTIEDHPWTGGGVNGPGTTVTNPVMPGRVWHF